MSEEGEQSIIRDDTKIVAFVKANDEKSCASEANRKEKRKRLRGRVI